MASVSNRDMRTLDKGSAGRLRSAMETFPIPSNGKGAGFLRVTLTQVAQRAGVSLASASRALNGESASARTIERVAQAAKDLAYVPDARAQSLKLGTTRQLSFAVADVGNHVYVEMLRAVEDAVREDGYRVLISSTGSAIAAEIELLQSLQRGYADGLIISPLRIDDELARRARPAADPGRGDRQPAPGAPRSTTSARTPPPA